LLRHTHKIWILLLAATLLSGCLSKKKAAPPVTDSSAAPDKLLYAKATSDIKRGHYTVGRLSLQTLINSYPDSEYLAKAKLAIADSYYKEGGTAGLKQSILEYKDFITFFPFLDEAPYAQLQVGMAHYRQMEKPDRDHAETVEAEAELQTFLEKYPNSPLAPQAEQRLREVQEVLAEGNFRIARFYFTRSANKAAGARLLELTNRYPLYSHADQANWMLGQIYEKTEQNEVAGQYYSRIVKDYPFSPLVADAKGKLTKFGVPVPSPDPAAIARMKKEEASSDRPGIVGRSFSVMRSRPDISAASHSGAPTLTPVGESGDETFSLRGKPNLTVGAAGSAPGNSATVETVTPGSTTPVTNSSGATPAPPDTTQSSSGSTDSDTAQPASTDASTQPANNVKESTSKKRKGIHRIVPF
jgi:outer membrane protein assembly factor BamD